MMATNESSVLSSLRELMKLEEARLTEERDAELRREALTAEASRDREQAAERRRQEEDSRALAERDREHQAAARLAAMREAEIAAALLAVQRDADAALRLESLRAQHEHEARLATLARDSGKRRLLSVVSGLGLALVLVVVGGGLELRRRSVATERDLAREQESAAAEAVVASKLKAAIETQDQQLETLRQAAAEARRTSQASGTSAVASAPSARIPPRSRPNDTGRKPPSPSSTSCAGNPDPLCGLPSSSTIR